MTDLDYMIEEFKGRYLNPVLPENFYTTPHEERPPIERIKWWDSPYLSFNNENYELWCLDGGAWDRPTLHGSYDSLNEAAKSGALLKTKLRGE